MESIGEKIRKVREDKGYSLDQVARDTHITRRFLEALEEENFSALPGESYVIGFLRSYAEYLGLNAEETVLLYRNMKLQEQPAPMNELLERPRVSLTTIIALVIIAIIVITAGIFLAISGSGTGSATMEAQTASPSPADDSKTLQADVLERAFINGDSINILVNGIPTEIQVGLKDDQVSLVVAGTAIALPAGKESLLDINQDGAMDLKVLVREIDAKANPRKVVVRFDRVVHSPQATTASPEASPATAAAGPAAPAVPTSAIPLGNTTQPARLKQPVPISEYSDPTISLSLRFDGATMFRYETDSGKREERMSITGETVNVAAAGWIRVWTTNGAKTNLKLGSRELKAGAEGEVAAWAIQWAAGANNSRQLQLLPMY
jgi:cytoskeletal protein RodZ